MTTKAEATYETVALSVLAYEFSFSKKEETEKKIKARLKRRKLGAYDGARIELLRKLKDELQQEIGKQGGSAYYVRPPRIRRGRRFAEMTDFDISRLTSDLIARYPGVPEGEIERFVPFATFIYHML